MRRWLSIAWVLLVLLCADLPPVSAGNFGDQSPDAGAAASGNEVSVTVSLEGANGRALAPARRARSSSGRPRVCGYLDPVAGAPSGPYLGMDLAAPFVDPQEGSSYFLVCFERTDTGRGALTYQQFVTWDPAQPWGPIDAGARAAQLARDAVVAPTPGLASSPPLGADLLVGFPTWFWTDTPWTPLTATATLAGVTATVTATPTRFTVDPGDRSGIVTCTGPGEAWTSGSDPDQSSCAHTYTRRSTSTAAPDGTYGVVATITWTVTWQATNGEAGELDPIETTTTRPVVVREAQALLR